jgi:microcystin-dependent protein
MNTNNSRRSAASVRSRLLPGVLAILVTWCGTSHVLAQANANPPERLTFQGYLTDATGVALGNNAPKNYDVIFRIWNSDANTDPANRLWTEQQTVTVDKGTFSVLLGEGSSIGEARPILSSLFTNATASDRWVGMTVKGIGSGGADVDILPRLRLLTAPYAFLASRAVTVDGAGVASGTVPDARLSSNVALRAGGNTFSGNQSFNNNVGLGVANPSARLQVSGGIKVNGANIIELGADIAGKEANAGKIGYTAFSTDALDIVGAGTASNRKLQVFAEGGSTFSGPVTASSFSGDGAVPIGGIIMWSGNTAPTGWAICDGQTVNGRTTPDLRGRFVLGLGNRAIGTTGGAETHTLTVNEMPAHSHTATDTGHFHNFPIGPGDAGARDKAADGDQAASKSVSTFTGFANVVIGNTGGGQAHNNMPPYYVLAFIMRVR